MSDLPSADIEMIQRILPHRYPFLLIDRVEMLDGTKSAVGIKNVTVNEPHFVGHFPQAPIMPGVLIVEAMGQTAGVMVGVANDYADRSMLVYLMAIDGVKLRRMVRPGDTLRIEVETRRGGGRVWRFGGRATVQGELAAEAEFTAMIVPPKS